MNISETNRHDKEDKLIEKIIQEIKLKVEERRALFKEMKRLYNPENDRKDSNIYYFLYRNPQLTKVSKKEIADYQERFNVKLPKIVIRVLTEIGNGKLINHNFLDGQGKLLKPFVCIEDEFLRRCIDGKIPPNFIEDGLNRDYDFEKNAFNDPKVQSIYESLGSNRDNNLTVLFGMGGHDACITLNRENKRELAVVDVCGITNKPFEVDGIEYESPYFMYSGGDVNTVILGGINTHYWVEMLEDIKEMNL